VSKEEFIEYVKEVRDAIDHQFGNIDVSYSLDEENETTVTLEMFAKRAMREALEQWATETIEEADEYV